MKDSDARMALAAVEPASGGDVSGSSAEPMGHLAVAAGSVGRAGGASSAAGASGLAKSFASRSKVAVASGVHRAAAGDASAAAALSSGRRSPGRAGLGQPSRSFHGAVPVAAAERQRLIAPGSVTGAASAALRGRLATVSSESSPGRAEQRSSSEAGASVRRVDTAASAADWGLTGPRWSPDGKRASDAWQAEHDAALRAAEAGAVSRAGASDTGAPRTYAAVGAGGGLRADAGGGVQPRRDVSDGAATSEELGGGWKGVVSAADAAEAAGREGAGSSTSFGARGGYGGSSGGGGTSGHRSGHGSGNRSGYRSGHRSGHGSGHRSGDELATDGPRRDVGSEWTPDVMSDAKTSPRVARLRQAQAALSPEQRLALERLAAERRGWRDRALAELMQVHSAAVTTMANRNTGWEVFGVTINARIAVALAVFVLSAAAWALRTSVVLAGEVSG